MTALWTAREIAAAVRGETSADFNVTGISIDSRTVSPGDLFVPLARDFESRPLARDGHAFIEEAFQRGAVSVLVGQTNSYTNDPRAIVVDDTYDALVALGAAARTRSQAITIAVTGSVGKTSTKDALRHVLSQQGITHASAASYNNDFGVPLSLARAPRDARYAIYEIGMNTPGEIARQAARVQPDIAIVTNVHSVHLEGLGSLEAIAREKASIFSGLKIDGTAIYGRFGEGFTACDAVHFENALVFSAEAQSGDAAVLKSFAIVDGLSEVEAEILGRTYRYRIGIPGRHIAENSLAVLLAVGAAGGNVAQAASDLASLSPLAGRGQRRAIPAKGGTALLIDESYNASPVSVKAALANLGATESKRRIAVLGDMLELGPDSGRFHRDLIDAIESQPIDQVFLSGANMRFLWEALPKHLQAHWAPDSTSLAPHVVAALQDGDVVLVKGSLGSRMKNVVEALIKTPEPADAV